MKDFKIIDSYEQNVEYCCTYNAEDVAELSNDFFCFLNNNKAFYNYLEVSEKDFIEAFMNLIIWLFAENFISYKIFLIDQGISKKLSIYFYKTIF